MTEPFLGEVQIFGFDFNPHGWALCNGASMLIQQNTSLYSLIGVQYGGNGTTSFNLPNLMNRAPCNPGAGPGLTRRSVGDAFGSNGVSLTVDNLPAHLHPVTSYAGPDHRSAEPTAGAGLSAPTATKCFLVNPTYDTSLAPSVIQPSGQNQPHENRQPFLALTFCIALTGVYPSFD